MPFGLCNAPATFERMIDTVLRGLKWKTCLCYLDDIAVFSSTFSQHLKRLDEVLTCHANAGLQLNTKKCHFASKTIKVLGHIMSKDGIRPDLDKVSAVLHSLRPEKTKDLRSFVSLASYFRRFIRDFASIVSPLHKLLGSNVPFLWSPECESAFARQLLHLNQYFAILMKLLLPFCIRMLVVTALVALSYSETTL